MASETGLYEGRKGQKRLKAIERQINSVNEEFDHRYADSPEMRYLSGESGQIRWIGMAGLIFAMAQRDVSFKWSGMMDYGFIRLCAKWLDDRDIDTVTEETAVAMMKDILPEELCSELRDEIAALEIL